MVIKSVLRIAVMDYLAQINSLKAEIERLEFLASRTRSISRELYYLGQCLSLNRELRLLIRAQRLRINRELRQVNSAIRNQNH